MLRLQQSILHQYLVLLTFDLIFYFTKAFFYISNI
jgi:hypothetical protein